VRLRRTRTVNEELAAREPLTAAGEAGEAAEQEGYRPGWVLMLLLTAGAIAATVFYLGELGIVDVPHAGTAGGVLLAVFVLGYVADLVIAFRSRNNPDDD